MQGNNTSRKPLKNKGIVEVHGDNKATCIQITKKIMTT
jgi:hypothetical protein